MTLRICIDVTCFTMADVALRVEEFLRESGCPDDLIFEIHLVAEELVVNVVNHGDSPHAEVCFEVQGSEVIVEISDSGPPFDPLQHKVQGLNDEFADRQIGGMGIHLVKEIMDELSYKYENGKNVLRAVKGFRK